MEKHNAKHSKSISEQQR